MTSKQAGKMLKKSDEPQLGFTIDEGHDLIK